MPATPDEYRAIVDNIDLPIPRRLPHTAYA